MILLIIVLALLCIIGYYIYKSIISPMVLFNGIWFLTLLFYNIKMSKFQNDLSIRCIQCILLCVIGYNLVYFIVCLVRKSDVLKLSVINNNVIINNMAEFKRHIVEKNMDFGQLLKSKFNISRKTFSIDSKIKYANVFIIVVFIIEIIYSKGFPLIWLLTNSTKNYFSFGIPSLNGVLYGLVIMMGAYSLMKKTKWKYFYLLFGVLVISRQVIMSMVIEGLIIYLLRNKEKLSKNAKIVFVLVAVASIIFFGIYGNIRTGKEAFNQVFEAREQFENVPTTVKWVYAYMEFAINNFNELVSITAGNVNKGMSMLNAFLPTIITNAISKQPIYEPYYLVKINFNVSTYLPPIYLDFGMVGILMFNILIGLWGYRLYKNRYLGEKNMIYYAVFAHNIIFILFGNFFLSISIMAQFVYAKIIFSEKREIQS